MMEKQIMSGEQKWCVVTGGRGFLGCHLVEMLIRKTMFLVRVVDLEPTLNLRSEGKNEVLANALKHGRAQYVSADIRSKDQVFKAIEGAKVVFHMAAPSPAVNSHQLHYSVNVQGTKNVIDACVDLKVRRLIYTSSAGVVFDGIHEIVNGDESLPYPAKAFDSYSATKTEAEAAVIKANGRNGLLTCCLRPCGMFGPGDKLFFPSLVAIAKSWKSKFIIGDGNNVHDFIYVENVAHAHICAERTLASESKVAERAAGQTYFINNMERIKFWEFISLVSKGFGYERQRIKIPVSIVMLFAYLVAWIYKLLEPYGMRVPEFSPSSIRLASCSMAFNCSKAKDEINYIPIVSLKEGLRRTLESYTHI